MQASLSKRVPRRYGIALLLFLGLPAPSRAQEVQIPLDEEGRIERLTPELEEELRLFPEYTEFRDARLFALPDSSYALEIEYGDSGRVARERRPMQREDMLHFRRTVSERIRTRAPDATLERAGRTRLIVGTTTLGTGFYGWAIPTAVRVESPRSFIAIYLITAGSSFLVPYLATKHARVTDGMATLGLQGGLRGIVDGFLVTSLIGSEDADGRLAIGLGTVFSIGEMAGCIAIADNTNMTDGSAGAISVCGNFGLGVGYATYALATTGPLDESRLAPALSLTGSVAGYAAGAYLSNAAHYTGGDATILATAGILGAAIPPAVLSVTDIEDRRPYVAAAIVGSVGGLAVGHILCAHRDFSSGQGTLISVGTSAGALFGLGIAALFSPERSSGKLYPILGSLGAAGAFALLVHGYAGEAESAAKASSWNVALSPAGLFAGAFRRGSAAPPLPVLLVSASF